MCVQLIYGMNFICSRASAKHVEIRTITTRLKTVTAANESACGQSVFLEASIEAATIILTTFGYSSVMIIRTYLGFSIYSIHILAKAFQL